MHSFKKLHISEKKILPHINDEQYFYAEARRRNIKNKIQQRKLDINLSTNQTNNHPE